MKLTLTPEIIKAATLDAGNKSMKANGRQTWSIDDYHAAIVESDRLWRNFDAEQREAKAQS